MILEDIPNEILSIIIDFLDWQDILQLGNVNQRFYELCKYKIKRKEYVIYDYQPLEPSGTYNITYLNPNRSNGFEITHTLSDNALLMLKNMNY